MATSKDSFDKEDLSKLEHTLKVDVVNGMESNTSSIGNIFKDAKVAEHYRNVYEDADYECKHLFVSDYTWIPDEEKNFIWKCDWRAKFWAHIMFTTLDFNRFNIAQAVSDNMLDDLGSNIDDFSNGKTANLVCFLAAELPSQLISKKLSAIPGSLHTCYYGLLLLLHKSVSLIILAF